MIDNIDIASYADELHHRNLQTLAYEIFNVKNNMAPELLTEIFS